jgi:MFS family permease
LISGFNVHGAAQRTDRAFTAAQAATVISIYGASNLAGRLLTGWLLDRYPAPRVAAVMLVLLASGGWLLSRAASMEGAVAAAVLIGFGAGGEIDINPYLLSRYFGMRSLATLYGCSWMALGISSAIGPILMGRAFDATGTYATLLSQLALVTLVAAGLMLTLPSPRLTSNSRRASS